MFIHKGRLDGLITCNTDISAANDLVNISQSGVNANNAGPRQYHTETGGIVLFSLLFVIFTSRFSYRLTLVSRSSHQGQPIVARTSADRLTIVRR
jgi:hypothetical protein